MLADSLPDISTGVYERTMRTISVTYADMLSVSQPSSANATPTFNAVKASANEAFENSSLGSVNGPSTYKPAYAAPANWYDTSQQTNWLHYSYSTGTPPPPPPPPPAGGTVYRPPVRMVAQATPWRLTMATPTTTPEPVAVTAQPVQMRAATLSAASVSPQVQASAAHPVVAQQRVFENERWLPPHVSPGPTPVPLPQPVLQPQFSMSFDYCIVGLSRPWFSGDFLASPGWYVPGAHQGDYSSGPLATADTSAVGTTPVASSTAPATGTQSAAPQAGTQPPSPGAFSVIPTAFIAVKNLTINAVGIASQAPGSQPVAAFGPFSLLHASASADSLSDNGIQLIAWICSSQPILPPDTDPALIPPPPANQTANVVQTAVNVLENLFGSGGNH